jgi:hypothetical protein
MSYVYVPKQCGINGTWLDPIGNKTNRTTPQSSRLFSWLFSAFPLTFSWRSIDCPVAIPTHKKQKEEHLTSVIYAYPTKLTKLPEFWQVLDLTWLLREFSFLQSVTPARHNKYDWHAKRIKYRPVYMLIVTASTYCILLYPSSFFYACGTLRDQCPPI